MASPANLGDSPNSPVSDESVAVEDGDDGDDGGDDDGSDEEAVRFWVTRLTPFFLQFV